MTTTSRRPGSTAGGVGQNRKSPHDGRTVSTQNRTKFNNVDIVK